MIPANPRSKKFFIYENLPKNNFVYDFCLLYRTVRDSKRWDAWCQVRGGSFVRTPAVCQEVSERGSDHPARGGVCGDAASLLLAVDPDREDESGDPDGHDQDVDHDSERAADAHGLEERLHVRDEDKASDGATEDTGGQDAHYVRGYRGGDHTAEKQGSHDGPRYLREAQGEEEPDARAEGHQELAGVDGADDLSRLHPPGGEQCRRSDWAHPHRRQRRGTRQRGPEEPGSPGGQASLEQTARAA